MSIISTYSASSPPAIHCHGVRPIRCLTGPADVVELVKDADTRLKHAMTVDGAFWTKTTARGLCTFKTAQ
jgi:hypothetical protein